MSTDDTETDSIEEAPAVLSVSQRRKRGRHMRRRKSRLKRSRKIRSKKKAGTDRLRGRARRAARSHLRKRVAGKAGERYKSLSPAKKAAIDKRVARKSKHVGRLARRMMPKVRKKERERLKSARSGKREALEREFEENRSLNELFDRFLTRLEKKERKVKRALREKARENEIPVSVIASVYERGLSDYHSCDRRGTITESQWAFQRVDSFLSGGKARQMDEDLWNKVEPLKNLIERMNLNEAKLPVPEDRLVRTMLNTFESLNKKEGVKAEDLEIEKMRGSKYRLTGKGGDMNFDDKTFKWMKLTLGGDMAGEWSKGLKNVKAKDAAEALKRAGVKEK